MKKFGFTLIELLLFIIILAFISEIFIINYQPLLKNSEQPTLLLQASQHAQARLEAILNEKKEKGFLNFSDPCVSHPQRVGCENSEASMTAINNFQKNILVTGFSNDHQMKITLTAWVTQTE